ncbi:hypothetical protein RvY_18694 [Ramazzottius varieornatus]|uniref:Uncharacterized protein n=1 Tax=Ramazzottius varieornatus TaxID=947166 RepID=A0A1D1W6Q0_RAMVA|nr:hypothetical protein RvY_18694 [Ramazzottius varieornatus]
MDGLRRAQRYGLPAPAGQCRAVIMDCFVTGKESADQQLVVFFKAREMHDMEIADIVMLVEGNGFTDISYDTHYYLSSRRTKLCCTAQLTAHHHTIPRLCTLHLQTVPGVNQSHSTSPMGSFVLACWSITVNMVERGSVVVDKIWSICRHRHLQPRHFTPMQA